MHYTFKLNLHKVYMNIANIWNKHFKSFFNSVKYNIKRVLIFLNRNIKKDRPDGVIRVVFILIHYAGYTWMLLKNVDLKNYWGQHNIIWKW